MIKRTKMQKGGGIGTSELATQKQYGGTDSGDVASANIGLIIIAVVAVIGLIVMLAYVVYLHNNTKHASMDRQHQDISSPSSITVMDNIMLTRDMQSNLAQERLINPLLPPEKSYDLSRTGRMQWYHGGSSGSSGGVVPINVHTRGEPGEFQQLGHLYKTDISNSNVNIGNNSDTAILPLFGRQLHNGSKKWTYYTTSDKYNAVKLPLTINGRKCDQSLGCDEVYSGDSINILPYNGKFNVEIYENDSPRYLA
jgi:hypothetical protein